MSETLRAGFAEADVTPEQGMPLAGMPGAPPATGMHSRLHGRVALFDDGARRVALAILDLSGLEAATVAAWRERLADIGGLAPQDVLVAATHTHRGPHGKLTGDVDRDDAYLDAVLERLTGAMGEAGATLAPAELHVGSVRAPGWSFNRRSLYRGGEVATQGPHWVEGFERVEGPVDDELQVLVARSRASGATLGGLVGFACHPTLIGEEAVYSADFPGALTEALAARHGGVFAYLQGACGDVSPKDMSAPGAARGGIADAELMGRALADAADAALAGARVVADPRVRAAADVLEIPQRRPTREQVELARRYLEEADREAVDQRELTRRLHDGHAYTFYADMPVVQAWLSRELIGMWEWQRRCGMRVPADRVEVAAVALGDVALAAYPAEMFAAFGLETKARSPFAATLVCELANGAHGYVPTREAFAHGGYETRLAHTSRLAEDAGERMVAAAVHLLERLHDGR